MIVARGFLSALCTLSAALGCTNSGLVGRVCGADGTVADACRGVSADDEARAAGGPDAAAADPSSDDALNGDAAPADAKLSSAEAGIADAAVDDASSAACYRRYADCTLTNVESFRQDICVPDAIACGAISEAQGIEIVCSVQFTRCLTGETAPERVLQCQRESEACTSAPWSDEGMTASVGS